MNITSLTLHHLWWIPSIIIYYAIYTILSKQNNVHSDIIPWYTSKYFWTMFLWGALCPFWLIISKISKNLTFDGMLYDNLMFLTFVVTMVILGGGSKFSLVQWIGLVLVSVGSVLMRIAK